VQHNLTIKSEGKLTSRNTVIVDERRDLAAQCCDARSIESAGSGHRISCLMSCSAEELSNSNHSQSKGCLRGFQRCWPIRLRSAAVDLGGCEP
jgi:hypothetical protein